MPPRVMAAFVLLLLGSAGSVVASPASPHPFQVDQPDGSAVTLHIRGDEYFHWLEDGAGFTVVRDGNAYRYATLDDEQQLVATALQVGKADPRKAGLTRRILPPPDVRDRIRRERAQATPQPTEPAMSVAAIEGSRKNIVIMMRFSNHMNRTLPSGADMDVLFNAVGGDPVLAPTGSVRDVYLENSYDQLAIDSTVFGWVDLAETESYYADGNSGLGFRLRQGIREALDAADPLIDFSQFDEDNNGYVDTIAFIHSGYGAEWGGINSPNRIWSHRSSIPTWTSDEGVKVNPYHISPGLWGSGGGGTIGRIGVICHETGHFLGLPDLYDTNGNGSGLGSYGMMANSWGFDGSQLYPPHFCAYSKIALGWLTPTVIDIGTYSAEQVEFSPTVYRIDSEFAPGEYLLIENRQPVGFDSIMPQGGLCVWHIDEGKCCNTDQGYPGQSGWPENNMHYRVALLQADGDYDLERNVNRGDGGDVYHGGGVSTIGPDTVPSTDGYRFGTVVETGILITDISQSDSAMSFSYVGAPLDPPARTAETALTNRYLRLQVPQPSHGGLEEIIRVTPVDLDGIVEPAPDVLYLGPPYDAPEEDTAFPGLTFTVAPLQCEPYTHAWSMEGIISAYGAEVIPGSVYDVQRASASCPVSAGEDCWSQPLTLTTALFGDVADFFNPAPSQPDFSDIGAMVRKFLSDPTGPIKAVAQLQPSIVDPLMPVDFMDISASVGAFVGDAYTDVIADSQPCLCPSTVTCGVTACDSDSACGSGRCIVGFCADRCGRCAP